MNDLNESSHSNGDFTNDICTVDGSAVEESMNLVKINNNEPRVSYQAYGSDFLKAF